MTQINKEEKFLHKELSYKFIGICMALHRDYKSVHNERIYQKALEERLESERIKFISKPKIAIRSRDTGDEIGYYEPDLVIEDKIVVELKAVPQVFRKHEIQLSEYLKVSGYEVGYVINFGLPSLYFRRIICSNSGKPFFAKIKGKKSA